MGANSNTKRYKINFIILFLFLSVFLSGCGIQKEAIPEFLSKIKYVFSYDESRGRVFMLAESENIIAVDSAWEDLNFGSEWLDQTPKLADKVAVVNDHNGYNLYWRESKESAGFYESLNKAALNEGFEVSEKAMYSDKCIYVKRHMEVERVYSDEYSQWGYMTVTIAITRREQVSEEHCNICAHYKVEWDADRELTEQKQGGVEK